MNGDFVIFPSFFVESKPGSPAFEKVILNIHIDDGTDAGKAKDHDPNQAPIPKPGDFPSIDRVQEGASFFSRENRGFSPLNHMFGATYRVCRIERHNLTNDQIIE